MKSFILSWNVRHCKNLEANIHTRIFLEIPRFIQTRVFTELKEYSFNLRHFEISPAFGGGGGGAFWPGPRKQGYGYRIDLKFATNNGNDDTNKHTKFKVIGCSTFRDMTSQIFPFQKGTSHGDSIFTPWNRAKLEKSHFLCIFSGTKLCVTLHFHGFQAKQKIHMFNFLRRLISETTAATPRVNRFCWKFCLIDKN